MAVGSRGSTDPATIESKILRYVTPTYIQDRSGKISHFDDVVAHLSQVRGKVTSLNLEIAIEDLVVSANERQFASRHTAVVDGNVQDRTTVVMFVELDANRKIDMVYEMAS